MRCALPLVRESPSTVISVHPSAPGSSQDATVEFEPESVLEAGCGSAHDAALRQWERFKQLMASDGDDYGDAVAGVAMGRRRGRGKRQGGRQGEGGEDGEEGVAGRGKRGRRGRGGARGGGRGRGRGGRGKKGRKRASSDTEEEDVSDGGSESE